MTHFELVKHEFPNRIRWTFIFVAFKPHAKWNKISIPRYYQHQLVVRTPVALLYLFLDKYSWNMHKPFYSPSYKRNSIINVLLQHFAIRWTTKVDTPLNKNTKLTTTWTSSVTWHTRCILACTKICTKIFWLTLVVTRNCITPWKRLTSALNDPTMFNMPQQKLVTMFQFLTTIMYFFHLKNVHGSHSVNQWLSSYFCILFSIV